MDNVLVPRAAGEKLGLRLRYDGDSLRVLAVLPDTAAARAGLVGHVEDREVVQVCGQPVSSGEEFSEICKGELDVVVGFRADPSYPPLPRCGVSGCLSVRRQGDALCARHRQEAKERAKLALSKEERLAEANRLFQMAENATRQRVLEAEAGAFAELLQDADDDVWEMEEARRRERAARKKLQQTMAALQAAEGAARLRSQQEERDARLAIEDFRVQEQARRKRLRQLMAALETGEMAARAQVQSEGRSAWLAIEDRRAEFEDRLAAADEDEIRRWHDVAGLRRATPGAVAGCCMPQCRRGRRYGALCEVHAPKCAMPGCRLRLTPQDVYSRNRYCGNHRLLMRGEVVRHVEVQLSTPALAAPQLAPPTPPERSLSDPSFEETESGFEDVEFGEATTTRSVAVVGDAGVWNPYGGHSIKQSLSRRVRTPRAPRTPSLDPVRPVAAELDDAGVSALAEAFKKQVGLSDEKVTSAFRVWKEVQEEAAPQAPPAQQPRAAQYVWATVTPPTPEAGSFPFSEPLPQWAASHSRSRVCEVQSPPLADRPRVRADQHPLARAMARKHPFQRAASLPTPPAAPPPALPKRAVQASPGSRRGESISCADFGWCAPPAPAGIDTDDFGWGPLSGGAGGPISAGDFGW